MYENYGKGNVLKLPHGRDAAAKYGTAQQLFHIDRYLTMLIAKLHDDSNGEEDLSLQYGLSVQSDTRSTHGL